jgi:UDP-N-acetylmuramyl pentapeptide phosphotransferase/UDP-N-acetylglucosamine-1-phosphate transferase
VIGAAPGDFLVAAAASALVTAVLVRAAARIGLVDDARDAPERKSHARPVPLAGGLAIAAGIGAPVVLRGPDVVGGAVLPGLAFEPLHVLVALALALAVGLCDDFLPRGLSVAWKLSGQIVASVPLALGLELHGVPAGAPAMLVCVLAGVAAQNAANTFDNADGALCAVAGAGLACATPLAGAVLAFLPFNLTRRAQRAWLGDSGSHLLGILLLTTPVAWAALVLPALDLARVVCVRAASGAPIARGDRRHLAHVLEARGLPPPAVAGVLVLLALPAIAAAYAFLRP